jgi:aspartate/glutamate racemase
MSYEERKIGIIHAAVFTASVIQTYVDELLPGVTVAHAGDDSVQNTNLASAVGTIPRRNYLKFATMCGWLEDYGCEVIVLGCSTFNRAVEYAQPMIETPLLQIDRPMMEEAVAAGRKVGLLATLPSTVPSSERLLRLAAEEAGKKVEIKTRLSSEAFTELRAGRPERHNEILLSEIDVLSREVDAIVLAQASMSALEPSLGKTRVPVLNSPRTGIARVKEMLDRSA